jgi:hypothetical protein
MRLQKMISSGTVLLLILAVPAPVSAQLGIAARASTLGVGAELSYRANRMLGLRVGGNFLEFSRDATIESIDYHVTPHFESGTAMVDLYPMGGSFHLTGGLLLNHNEGRMQARLNQDIVIGGQTYPASQVGSLVGLVDFKKTAPYVGLGFAGRGRVSLLFDLGVGFTGTPRVGLVGTTSLTGSAKTEFDSRVAQEQADVQADINGKSYLKFHPLIGFGLKFGF